MNKFRGLCLAFCVCSLFATGSIGEITVTPLNMATGVGDATIINCSSDIAGALTWLYTTDCNTGTGTVLTENNCDVTSSYTAHYRTEKPDEFSCNLVVFDAVLSLGGCYVCSDGFGVGRQYSALLIIVDSSASITSNSTDLISGEGVVISCSVSYRGPSIPQQPIPLPPSFYWTLLSDPSQNITSYTGVTTSTSASSYIIVTAQPPEIPPYESHIFFKLPLYVPGGCASNAPTYTDVTPTPPYPVSYPPEDISISGYPTACPYDENVDTPLKCSASGYPSPSYEWVELSKPDEILSTTDTLMIRADGIYQCTASNVIRGVKYAIFTVANISDCFPCIEPAKPSNFGAIREITVRPLNMATSVGGATYINCSSDIPGALTWLYTTDCNTGTGTLLTENNCDVTSSYTAHYRTEKPDEFSCNLVVFDAVLSLGGCYVCSDGLGLGRQYSALLIIVDSNAYITTNSTDLISGEDVTISCNVAYKESSIQPSPIPPSLYWKLASDPGQNIPSYPGSTTNTSASSYIIVTAQPPNVPPYLCNLFFNPPNYVPPGGASNAPAYSQSWTTVTYPVLYMPENVLVPGQPNECLDAPVELSCSASGYPMPTYKWYNVTSGKVLSDNDTIKIESAGTYQCNASNTIRNVTYTASSRVVVVVESCVNSQNSTSLCVKLGASDTVCIIILVIVVYFGINLLFFTIFITCYACSENGRNTMNDRFLWLKKMLPCLNDEGCKCSIWIFYFVFLSIFVAIVFFPTIMIMASCCKNTKKKSSQGNVQLKERSGRGAGSTQVNSRGTTPNQSPSRLSVTTNPPSSLPTTAHYPQDPPSRPYPHSSNQQLQPTYSEYSDPYPRNLRQTPSPALSAGVVYAELGVDNKPMSRRPIQPIQGDGDAYAAIALA